MTKAAAALLLAVAAATASAAGGSGVRGTKHDLSIFGPGPIKATTEANPCTFCHIPHTRGANRPETRGHIPYESSTMKVRPGLPTGATRVCLSCHDGTIAVGQTTFRRISMVIDVIPAGRPSNLGTDLRKTHPVSFTPAPGDGGTHAPPPGDSVRLDKTGQVQCTSCHDPHDEFKGDPAVGKFLVKSERNAELCLTCHEIGRVAPPGASHAGAAASFDVPQGNTLRFVSVAEAGCRACHRPHGAAPEGRILDRAPNDDDGLCLRCHSGPVARVNVRADWTKPYSHGAAGGPAGVHDAAEGRPGARRALPESSPGAQRHVVCADCHEPHAARREPSTGAPLAGGALAGSWGVELSGQRVEPARFEYEVCLKCHGDSANKPQALGGRRGDSIRRASGDYDLRTQIAPTAISAHPIAGPGRSADVPGLKAPYTAQSVIFCGDCHGSDSSPARGGSGSRGPHGSIYPFLLDANYDTRDGTVETVQSYALCYRCHDRDVLLSTQSRFTRQAVTQGTSLHRLHVVQQNTPCSACHAAHGISAQWGTAQENAHLVDFDALVVKQRAGAPRRYRSAGVGHGSCNLSCHGKDHDEATATY